MHPIEKPRSDMATFARREAKRTSRLNVTCTLPQTSDPSR
jgi:hypothetical protein